MCRRRAHGGGHWGPPRNRDRGVCGGWSPAGGVPGLSRRGLPAVGALAGAARGTFTVGAWPRVAVVPFGGSVAINCSRSACPGGNATLGLETPLTVDAGAGGRRWQSFRLLNVSQWSPGTATCYGRCGDTQVNASTGILVYRECRGSGGRAERGGRGRPFGGCHLPGLPERVVLEPVPAMAVGDSRNLTCRVVEVAPVGNLTVTLRRGAETLRTESFGAAEGSASVAVSHLLTASPGDHGQDVTCHAELSLRPHGPLFARAAVPVKLSVFGKSPPRGRAPALVRMLLSEGEGAREQLSTTLSPSQLIPVPIWSPSQSRPHPHSHPRLISISIPVPSPFHSCPQSPSQSCPHPHPSFNSISNPVPSPPHSYSQSPSPCCPHPHFHPSPVPIPSPIPIPASIPFPSQSCPHSHAVPIPIPIPILFPSRTLWDWLAEHRDSNPVRDAHRAVPNPSLALSSGRGRAGMPGPTLARGLHHRPPGSSASSPEPGEGPAAGILYPALGCSRG